MLRILTVSVVLAAVPLLLAQDAKPNQPAEEQAAMKKLEQAKAAGQSASAPTTAPASAPASGAAGGLRPRVKLDTTLGPIVLELDGEKAPISTKNFLEYTDAGFYNGLIFHRVMSNFMIQGGGYTPDMKEKTAGLRPPIKNEWQNGLKNNRGTIAMARTAAPDSATAQFFINVVDNAALDQPRGGAAYAVFGRVVEGMDTVDKIKDTEVTENPALPMGKVVPREPVVIQRIQVVREYDKKALAEKVEAAAKGAAAQSATGEKEVQEFVTKTATELGKKAQKTASGIYYWVIKDGTGDSPKPTDKVTVNYRGTFMDGREFDSSYKAGKPATFSLNGVIKGWTEGVGLMKVGASYKFLIPPQLAYPNGRPGIPPNSWLAFDIELLSIQQ